jgi:TRAP transporter TAXI family solute receptor
VAPIVLERSAIQSFEQLAGKRLSPGPAGGSAATLYRTLLEQAGMLDKVRLQFGSWRECFDAIKGGAVDCTVSVAYSGKPAAVVTELEAAHKIRVLEVPKGPLEKANAINPGILIGETSPERWPASGPKPLVEPGFSGVLAAHPRITPEMGYEITKTIFDRAEEVRKIAAELQEIRLDFATKYLLKGVPVNAGAAQYFKEKGVWRDELTIAS